MLRAVQQRHEGLKKDPGCFDRDWDLPGAGTGLWFPFDMLSEIKK